MTRFFRQLFCPNKSNRGIFSGLLAAFLLAVLVFSSAFVAVEADHDCTGHDCPICLEMQNCVANLQLLGSSTASGTIRLPQTGHFTIETVPCARRAPATTLQSLDVRFDE